MVDPNDLIGKNMAAEWGSADRASCISTNTLKLLVSDSRQSVSQQSLSLVDSRPASLDLSNLVPLSELNGAPRPIRLSQCSGEWLWQW
jgi:hypothetical protein